MKKLIFISLFLFVGNSMFSQVIIPNNAKETVEIGNTGWGTSLNKVPNSNYYNFTQQYYDMGSKTNGFDSGRICKLYFAATPKEINDLYSFLLSKFGDKSKTEIILGDSKILVIYDGDVLSVGNKECNFSVSNKNKLIRLFGK